MPEQSIPREAAYQIINDELMLDSIPRLSLASCVTTWMESECDKLIMGSINKNYIDMDEYPVITELQLTYTRMPLEPSLREHPPPSHTQSCSTGHQWPSCSSMALSPFSPMRSLIYCPCSFRDG
ncbi:hypothetical protein E2562_009713 [Oryza meyeriana var. granulata]|uniref:Glutamate decarboxylase n=1 Tax=Oryza meyeriana var. granulata TaxID=110450 RepID=A0A6G1D1Y5_9ORYZ|nr:hypothetical protein E2562_009713 [Oryza meyeriana var. granulata]